MDATIAVERIREGAGVIDPAFLHSPQFVCEPLSARTGVTTVLKVESVNPIRSFKGRGADYLLHSLVSSPSTGAAPLRGTKGEGLRIVCASAGNFGQGMAYACRKRGIPITVFAAQGANPLKVERMRALGATVVLEGDDFDQAKDAARRHAEDHGQLFVEDGRIGAIGEGAGTIAVELTQSEAPFDAVFVPLGNGSLVNGVGTWLKHASPQTKVIAVCAAAAPSMALSWKARKAIDAPSSTIADGIAVRVPVREALDMMGATVDEVLLVSEDEMRTAMRHVFDDAGLVIEPAGVAGVAAIAGHRREFEGQRVATILTGGNLTEQQIEEWIY